MTKNITSVTETLSLQSLVLQWLDYLAIQHYSQHTLEAYHRDITDFFEHCKDEKLDIYQFTVSDLRQYIAQNIEQKMWSNATVQRMLSTIRQFIQWLQNQGITGLASVQDFKIKRQPRPLPGMLAPKDIEQLLDQKEPISEKEQWLWTRDKAMLELLYSSGLRLNELVTLTLNDIDFSEKMIRVTGKGNKTRMIPFGEKAKQALQKWLLLRQQFFMISSHDNTKSKEPHHFIFISQRGNQISNRQVQNRIKIQAQRAGLSADIYPHLLRHCFASHLLAESKDMRAIQEMLGHSNINTTQIYTHLNFQQLAQVYDKAHPRAKKK